MKVYLVGGAVRDSLLHRPVTERDYVVVGGTPEQMIQLGYQKVGREFPVFLHPKTKEEYALARTEKKSGHGYYGFDCDFSSHITLEEDLLRRDLTINAIAMDEQGRIIDPYQGIADLTQKCLRHVSDAFSEDPVRVLRVARFAARFHHLGFTLAKETRLLMYRMVKAGELDHLVPERVWQELARSLSEENPEQFVLTLRQCGALPIIFPEIDALFGVPNPPKHHPEVDSGIHTLMVLEKACALSTDATVRFASLVHDLGKALSPMNSWPSHHGHEEKGLMPIDSLCQRLKVPTEYKQLARMVCQYHLLIHKLFEMKASTIVKILERTDAFRRPQFFDKLLVACEADASGRLNSAYYPQQEKWREIHQACAALTPRLFLSEGLSGEAIKHKLHEIRVDKVKEILTQWKQHENSR